MKKLTLDSPCSGDRPCTGAELVEYWQREGLLGYRSDIPVAAAHARRVRRRAEGRRRLDALRRGPAPER